MNSYISLDTEATGLSPKHDKIIEIGAVKVKDGEIVNTFSTFINPGRRLPENIVSLTGITDDDLKDAPDISEVIGDFTAFCEDLPLLGHHLISDYAIVKQACVNEKLAFEKDGIDTLRISRAVFPELPSKRLSDMCEHYDISINAHRALNDAIATHELFVKLFDEFNDKEPALFEPQKLNHKVKKETPIRKAQIERIKSMCERFSVDCPYEIEKLSCNEASRYIDKLISEYGKQPKS